jgi:hypothetical protein
MERWWNINAAGCLQPIQIVVWANRRLINWNNIALAEIAGRVGWTMSRKRKRKKLIEFSNFSEERYLRWKLAVDLTTKDLKSPLEKLSFNVLSFFGEQYAPELNESLIEAKIGFFITTREPMYWKHQFNFFHEYHLLLIREYLLDDLPKTAKAIEDAILYDTTFKSWRKSSLVLDGWYITMLPELKKWWRKTSKL